MRQIKFRAWHKKEKKMAQVTELDLDCAYNGTGKKCWGLLWIDAGDKDFRLEQWKRQEVELMQYIGLKDKNGKEIYEGDIVKGWNGGMNLVIEWRGCMFGYVNASMWISLGNDLSFDNSSFEVIGNIYENPELLPKPL